MCSLGLGIVSSILMIVSSNENSVYYDLSHVVKENITKWPTSKGLTREVNTGFKSNGIWYQSESVTMGTHLGTHLDAPCHFAKDVWCVDDIPFERLANVPVAVIDIRHKIFSGHDVINRDAELLPGDLRDWEDRNGQLPAGVLVMVLTGFGRFFNDTKMYRGTTLDDPKLHSFPGVSPTAADWLVKFRKVYGVGIDGLSIDYGKGNGQTHEILGKNNVYILENVSPVLNQLPHKGTFMHVGVMRLGGRASGATARLIAQVPSYKHTPIASSSLSIFPSLLLIISLHVLSLLKI